MKTLALSTLVLIALPAAAAEPPESLRSALAEQRRIVAERPADGPALNDLGNLLVLAGQRREAESAYRQAISLSPQDTDPRFNLALLLQQRDQPRQAKELLRQVLELDPAHAWAEYQLGTLFAEKGNEKRAVRHYSRALTLDPQLAQASVNPHLVENHLATWAQLRAYSKLSAGSLAPRIYTDPSRIAGLLMPWQVSAEGVLESGGPAQDPEAGPPQSTHQPPPAATRQPPPAAPQQPPPG